MLTEKFELGDDVFQDCRDFIGMHFEFNDDRSIVHISQPLKVAQLITSSGLAECKSSFTPGVPKELVSTLESPNPDDEGYEEHKDYMKGKPYRSQIGQLLWITRTTRPDIAYQVNALARVAHNPGRLHWHATTKSIKCISHTRDVGLTYRRSGTHHGVPGQWKPVVWTDATWASDYGNVYDNYRSTTGWVATICDNVVSWSSHRQGAVAQASAESEWYAGVEGAKEAYFLRHLFRDIGILIHGPISLRCDNKSAISQSINAVNQRNSRHIGMKSHYLRQQCHAGNIQMEFVPTTEQRADIFTKCLAETAHTYLRLQMMVCSIKGAFHNMSFPVHT